MSLTVLPVIMVSSYFFDYLY